MGATWGIARTTFFGRGGDRPSAPMEWAPMNDAGIHDGSRQTVSRCRSLIASASLVYFQLFCSVAYING